MDRRTLRLALFGGSFNPPHIGHQMVMLYVLATQRVDRLLMLPCYRHPFEKALAPFEHRLSMCRLAASLFGASVEVSDLEAHLGGHSRTLLTVKALRAQHPEAELVLVIGSDLVAERERWYGADELATLVELVVVGRSGADDAEAAEARVLLPQISSSEVRSRLAAGHSVATLVPAAVVDYIAEHGLYRAPKDDGGP